MTNAYFGSHVHLGVWGGGQERRRDCKSESLGEGGREGVSEGRKSKSEGEEKGRGCKE